MASIFVYGTLMCRDIFELVSGFKSTPKKATLKGFRRFEVKDEHYPGVIRQEGFEVQGLLYDNVPEQGMILLDAFEGEIYEREEVKVLHEGGKRVEAFVYVVKPKYTHLMGTCDWSFDRFLKTGKTKFIEGYPGFNGLGQKEKSDSSK